MDILCTHPMFGPDSGKDSWKDLNFMYEKVRIGGSSERQRRLASFLKVRRVAPRLSAAWIIQDINTILVSNVATFSQLLSSSRMGIMNHMEIQSQWSLRGGM